MLATATRLIDELRIQIIMIVGNPNAGRKLAALLIAVLLMMIAITVLIAARKRSAPAPEPPLHPSTIVLIQPFWKQFINDRSWM